MELQKKVLNCMNQFDLQDNAKNLYALTTENLVGAISDVVDTMEREGVEIPESLAGIGIAFTGKQREVISALQELTKIKDALWRVIESAAIDNKPTE